MTRYGFTVASISVEAMPPATEGSSTAKSTREENTGYISLNVRRLFSPEKLTEVEYIGPEILSTSCIKLSEGTRTACVSPLSLSRTIAVRGAGHLSIMSLGISKEEDAASSFDMSVMNDLDCGLLFIS